MTEREATPAAAVAVPSPATVPLPETWAKVTTVVLSEVTVLPAASRMVAVSPFEAPDVVVPLWVSWSAAGAPWTIV